MVMLVSIVVFSLCIHGIAGEEYLVGLVDSEPSVYITASVGKGKGTTDITFPNGNKTESCDLGPFSKCDIIIPREDYSALGLDNKSIVINTSSSDVSVNVYFPRAAFTPLPMKALGKRYLLPFCDTVKTSSRFLVASGSEEVNFTITFRLKPQNFKYGEKTYNDGDTLKVSLEPFETFVLDHQKFDITGTAIEASNAFAVFIAYMYLSSGKPWVYTCDQIPPVKDFGREYVIPTNDKQHTLQIMSDQLDNTVTFSDGRSVKTRFYKEELFGNATVYVKSSQPVMASLCTDVSSGRAVFAILQPLNSFGKTEVSLFDPVGHVAASVTIVKKSSVSIAVEQFAESISPEWNSTDNALYEVGTFITTNQYATSITGNGDFMAMIWGTYDLRLGGNRYFREVQDGGTTPPCGNDDMTLIVGIICGVVIAVLLILVAVMGIYIYRLRKRVSADEGPLPNVPRPRGVSNTAYDNTDLEQDYDQPDQPERPQESPYERIRTAAL